MLKPMSESGEIVVLNEPAPDPAEYVWSQGTMSPQALARWIDAVRVYAKGNSHYPRTTDEIADFAIAELRRMCGFP
jgi:hypothetical protein